MILFLQLFDNKYIVAFSPLYNFDVAHYKICENFEIIRHSFDAFLLITNLYTIHPNSYEIKNYIFNIY